MPNLDSYLERFENYQKEQEELNEIFDPDDRRCRVCGCTNLMHAQGVVIGLKKTYAVNVYRKRTKKADKKLFAFFTYIFYTIKKRGF